MPRQRVESYIAYPAIIPYPVVRFVGFALKWSIILLCVASVPFTLYSCYRVVEQVAHNPKSVHTTPQYRRHTPSTPKGQRP